MESHGQPINWRRAFLSGAAGTLLMLAFIDFCNLAGLTPFSMERYLGSVFYTGSSASHWTLGFFVNLVVGGLLSVFYAYNFEYVFRHSGVGLGTRLGFGHAVIAALFVFPFFGVIHDQLGTGVQFGFFGAALGVATPIILLAAHLMYGACVGLFYGPVRNERIRALYSEPGEVGLSARMRGVITPDEDPVDAAYT